MMNKYKAMRDLFRELYIFESPDFILASKDFMDVGKDIWEEIEGKELELKNKE